MTGSECQCLCAPAGHQPQICTGTAERGKAVRLPGSPAETFVPACGPCYAAALVKQGYAPVRRTGEQPRRLDARDWDAAALSRPGRRSARWPRATS